MLFWLILTSVIFEKVNDFPLIDGGHYMVMYSEEGCGPCNSLYNDVFQGTHRKEVDDLYIKVLFFDNKKSLLNGKIKEKEPIIPAIIIYKYTSGKMVPIPGAKIVGYERSSKESILSFLRKWKNEKSQVELIEELPSIVTGIFGK